jgi:hypothetical protein
MNTLRFFFARYRAPLESTHVRAMHLSFAQCQSHPGTIDGGCSQLYPWASPSPAFSTICASPVGNRVLITADLGLSSGCVSLTTPDDLSLAGQRLRVHSVNERSKLGADSTGQRVGVWDFPPGTFVCSVLCA